ncbi:hypothetical protein NMY22_g11942 [Coprinellus aureogranulatus]|nr:hypothetical protein NMY22_g11942 [Coprinellus aureogranulatus]
MTSRLDRLLLLLDTGSSQSVRNTAAKQLAQLAVKSVTSNVAIVEEDTKAIRQQPVSRDQASWAELMSVVARIIPYLHSKSFDTRTAASVALSQIFSLAPVWQPQHGDYSKTPPDIPCENVPEYPKFSLRELLTQGKLLLASSGKEFLKPAGILSSAAEVKKARKEAMSRLGLEFLDEVADDMDLDKELAEDMVVDDPLNVPPTSGDVTSSLSTMEINTPDQPPSKESSLPPRDDTPSGPFPPFIRRRESCS